MSQDHSAAFTKLRQKKVDRAYLEVTRLEKRLPKLTQILTQSFEDDAGGAGSLPWPLSGAKSPR